MPAVPLPSPEILNLLILALALSASLVTGFLVWRFVLRPLEQMKQRLSDERAQFEARAHDDPLTGLLNRRAFDERLDAELRRAAREYYSVAIAVVKLETEGAHIELTQQLGRELRAGDIAGRIGDGEFALALVRADAYAGDRVLARIDDALPSVALSAGIAEFPRDARTPADVLSKADQARAWGKASGHGPVAIFAPAGHDDASSPQESAEAAHERSLVPTLEGIAREVDSKSRWTVGHCDRVAAYAVRLASSFDLPDERIEAIRQAALLHDVGKIGIKVAILTKEQPLNLEELEELERHSELGRAMIGGAGLPELARWVHHLHERFDGKGYPFGLAGEEIPIESRLLHAADAFDHMTRPSALRRNRPLREALAELSYCAGTRVDPEIAARLIELAESGELAIDAGDELATQPRRPLKVRR